jgi:hypothetical protein
VTIEEQLAAANKSIEEMKPVLAKLPEMSAGLEALGKKNAELETKLNQKDEEIKKLAGSTEERDFKTEFPGLDPNLVAGATFADKRTNAMKLAELARPKNPNGNSGPSGDWRDAGRISASTDAEREAQRVEQQKREDEAVKKGDTVGVAREVIARQLPKLANFFKAGRA